MATALTRDDRRDILRATVFLCSTPLETPQKTLEDQAWSAAARIQADLESELMLLREKLLNIHLQFCSGATHENLVYDLAFTAEGIQTVLTTASDLGRSFAILKEHLQQFFRGHIFTTFVLCNILQHIHINPPTRRYTSVFPVLYFSDKSDT